MAVDTQYKCKCGSTRFTILKHNGYSRIVCVSCESKLDVSKREAAE